MCHNFNPILTSTIFYLGKLWGEFILHIFWIILPTHANCVNLANRGGRTDVFDLQFSLDTNPGLTMEYLGTFKT